MLFVQGGGSSPVHLCGVAGRSCLVQYGAHVDVSPQRAEESSAASVYMFMVNTSYGPSCQLNPTFDNSNPPNGAISLDHEHKCCVCVCVCVKHRVSNGRILVSCRPSRGHRLVHSLPVSRGNAQREPTGGSIIKRLVGSIMDL